MDERLTLKELGALLLAAVFLEVLFGGFIFGVIQVWKMVTG